MARDKLYIGLDAGGSKTELHARATAVDADLILRGPAANLQRQGQDGTAAVLADLIAQALAKWPDATLESVCAGIAGAGRPPEREALAALVRQRLGDRAPRHLLVVHDAEIALEGAFEGGTGIIVIAGTGSVVLARDASGEMLRAGGWGYLLGDEGSGHVLGQEALHAVANALDGGPPTRLQALVAERLQITTPDELIHHVYRADRPVQQAAPLLLQAAAEQDAVALTVLDRQTTALAAQVGWVAARCRAIEQRIALLGGLTQEATYRKALIRSLEARLPGWRLEKPAYGAATGALRLAQQAG